MHIGYRSDIDGLRFIAVGSVVLFHAGLGSMSGGFVGVDIFFVISGYLISAGLFKDAETQGISIARFYERRIKRIIPAYGAVILAALLAGLFLLLPSELTDLGKSALAATLFVANIHFWTGAGYFSGDPLSHPLLHLWSLAVEEQFYIVWPVAVLLLYRLGLARWRVPMIVATLVITLAASQLMLGYSAKTAFYMAPLRAWELLTGALLACGHWPRLKSGWIAHTIGAAALVLILVPIFTYTQATQFPGVAAIPSCLGTALAIYRDERHPSFLARLLSHKIPVFIGTISYSLYIWHWPILSFAWIARGSLPTGPALWALLALTLAVSALSWRFIEQPFRTRRQSRPPAQSRPDRTRRTLALGGAALTMLAVFTGSMVALHGLPGRLPPQAARIDSIVRAPYATRDGCVFSDRVPADAGPRCFASADHTPGAKIVLWGDSFAGQHIKTIEQQFQTAGQNVVSVIATGCSPLPGTGQYFGKGRADTRCERMNSAILDQLQNRHDIRGVIIAGRWSNLYGLQAPGGAFDPTARFLTDANHPHRSLNSSLGAMEASLDQTLTILRARNIAVALLREPPRYPQAVQPCIARALWHSLSPDRCAITTIDEDKFRGPINAIFTHLATKHPDVTIFDPAPHLCPDGQCRGFRDGILLTHDLEHLTPAGSKVALTGLALFPARHLFQ